MYIITTGNDGIVRLFNVHAQCLESEFEANRDRENDLDISPDDKFVVTVGQDDKIIIIDMFNQKTAILQQFFGAAQKIEMLTSIDSDELT